MFACLFVFLVNCFVWVIFGLWFIALLLAWKLLFCDCFIAFMLICALMIRCGWWDFAWCLMWVVLRCDCCGGIDVRCCVALVIASWVCCFFCLYLGFAYVVCVLFFVLMLWIDGFDNCIWLAHFFCLFSLLLCVYLGYCCVVVGLLVVVFTLFSVFGLSRFRFVLLVIVFAIVAFEGLVWSFELVVCWNWLLRGLGLLCLVFPFDCGIVTSRAVCFGFLMRV